MDRYLFRGKRVDNGEWVEGNLLHPLNPETQGYYIVPVGYALHRMTEVDPTTIGQCTGLKDKNGKLIFEGDAVTRIAPIYQIGKNEPIGEYQPIGVVRILEDGDEPPYFTVKANDHLGNETDMLLFVRAKGWHRPWYVIGNAYDNPELLA